MASAPKSPDAASSASWALPVGGDQQQVDTRETIYRELLPIVKAMGGPAQYVRKTLADRLHVQEYAGWLWAEWPEDSSHAYEYHRALPTTDESTQAMTPPLCMHVATLAYTENSSLKTFPTLEVFDELAQQILQDGFCTQTEPLLFSQVIENFNGDLNAPWKDQDPQPLKPFTVPYTKGSGRCITLHAILLYCWKNGLSLETRLPKVYDSILKIYGHCRAHGSKVDEALENMKISLRGSIRKKTNLIQTAMMLMKLTDEHGLADFSEFLRRWNSTSGRSTAAITGKKAQALKLLFQSTPKDCPYRMMDHGRQLAGNHDPYLDQRVRGP